MSGNEAQDFMDAECAAARELLLALAPEEKAPIKYKDLWPQVLARHVVRRPTVNQIAADLRKKGLLVFPDWEEKKRVPQPEYILFRKT
jgi:hypothetical protein